MKSLSRGWLARPAGRGWVVAVGLLVLVAPLCLWVDPLDGYNVRSEGLGGLVGRAGGMLRPFATATVSGDDFAYVAGSRTLADLRRSILTTHNAHLVPAFRIWTYLWVRASGGLSDLAGSLAAAAYLTYVAAMILIGRIVARETGRTDLGLGAMAIFGVSSVLEETARWYAASQAIAAGVCVLAMLAALQGWRWQGRGGGWRLGLATVAAAVAPLVWTVGYVAGPVGAAYLWAEGRPRSRRWAALPMAASIAVGLVAFGLTGREVAAAGNFHGRALTEAVDPIQGAISTVQGIVEFLVVGNLGLAAETTPLQASALLLLLVGLWAATRGRPVRVGPLEAAGALMVGLGFASVYTARGYYAFENLRALHWYAAVPAIGAVLLVAGWWASRSGVEPGAMTNGSTRGGLLAVVGVVGVGLAIHGPRVHAHLVASVPAPTASERARFPIPVLRRLRARYLRSEIADRQRRDFARLDRAATLARARSIGRAAIREAVGGATGPRIPLGFGSERGFDPVDLLPIPEVGAATVAPASIRAEFSPLLTPEPVPRPPWLDPGDRWPPGG